MLDNGHFRAAAPCVRAARMAARALQQRGRRRGDGLARGWRGKAETFLGGLWYVVLTVGSTDLSDLVGIGPGGRIQLVSRHKCDDAVVVEIYTHKELPRRQPHAVGEQSIEVYSPFFLKKLLVHLLGYVGAVASTHGEHGQRPSPSAIWSEPALGSSGPGDNSSETSSRVVLWELLDLVKPAPQVTAGSPDSNARA